MSVFQAYSPTVEVNGRTVFAFVKGLGLLKPMVIKILERVGLENPDPFQWYSQQKWLDAFRIMEEEAGPATLFRIGNSIPDQSDFPKNIRDIHSALEAIDVAYHMNHRGGEIGSYTYEKINERRVKMECCNPYPSDFDRGVIAGAARKFASIGAFVSVMLDETRPTRKKGGECCTFIVKW